jgi:hypothetical protein
MRARADAGGRRDWVSGEIGFSGRVDGGHGDELGKDTQNPYLQRGQSATVQVELPSPG